jgi:hypothetical protein
LYVNVCVKGIYVERKKEFESNESFIHNTTRLQLQQIDGHNTPLKPQVRRRLSSVGVGFDEADMPRAATPSFMQLRSSHFNAKGYL